MTTLVISGLILSVLLTAVLLARVVRHDGLGHRPPPPSRHDWEESSRW